MTESWVDPTDIHPKLVEWIDRQGKEILSRVTGLSASAERRSTKQFAPDFEPDITITQDDVQGNIVAEGRDERNELDYLVLHARRGSYRIDRAGCDLLTGVLNKLAETPGYGTQISPKTTKRNVLDWVEESRGGRTESLWRFLCQHVPHIEEVEVWIPVKLLSIESSFRLGDVTFRPITRDVVDDWQEVFPDSEVEGGQLSNLQRHQGRAAATVAVVAEQDFAVEKAVLSAREAVALLRLFTSEIMLGHRSSRLELPALLENREYEAYLRKDGEWCGGVANATTNPADLLTIDNARLEAMRKAGFAALEDLMDSRSTFSEFQSGLHRSLLLYLRSALEPTPHEKIVPVFAAIEQLVRRKLGIQQTAAEAIAFVVSRDRAERMEIVKTVKAAYEVRSRFLHVDEQAEEAATVNAFLRYAWRFFIALLANHDVLHTQGDLLSFIDSRKYS